MSSFAIFSNKIGQLPTGNERSRQLQFQQLGKDLQSDDLSAAQKDFSTLQQDIQNRAGLTSTRVHHHHGGGSASIQNSLLQDLNQVGQNLSSSNLAGARQAYATLQQQLQQFALGGGALNSESPVSLLG